MNLLTKFLLEDLLEEDNRDYIIYFDVDDTLSNYTQNLATTFIKDPETGEDRKIKPQDTVENLDYWLNAPIIPGAKEMVDFAKNNFNKVEILSAVPELSKANKELTGKRFFDAPIDGKTEWVTKNIGLLPMNWSKNGKEKALWATPNSVLIDDKPENIRAFEQAGGIGILIDTPQNVIIKLKDLLEGKEIINEGRYDSLTRMIVKDIINDWKSQYDGTPEILEYNEDYESENSKGQSINFELYATLNVKETKTEVYRVDGGADPLRTPAYLEIKFQVDPRDLPQKWETIYNDLIDVVRHEIEHLTQAGSNVISSKEMNDDEILRDLIALKVLPKSEYFKLEKEVDAMLQGMYLKAKKSKIPFKDVIDDYFDKVRLNKKDRNNILDLWKQRAKALSLPLQENLINTDYKEKIQDLTKYMLDKGMNIRPLPKVKFIHDDSKNAEDFFGKTAYYNPNDKLIVLYTYGRHPKDIVRSFSHEMIHHMQNLEGRIGNGNINTTNTNEDDYLETIEKEAYLNGNIEFRKWSDSKTKLDEGILDKTKNLITTFKSAYKDQTGDFKGFKELFTKYIKKQELTPEEKEKLHRNVVDIFKMSAIPILGISGTTLLGTLTNFLSKGKFSTYPSKFKDKFFPINEVGEANLEPYKWTEVDSSGRVTSIEFTTPSETKYEVDLTHIEIDDPEDEDMSMEAMDIEFLAKPKGAEGSSSKIVVNKGELYRVMSTITNIIKHYLRQYRGDIKAILYSPSKKSSEEDFGNQRDNLYKAFILKVFPDAKIEQQGENIITYFPGNAIIPEIGETSDPQAGTALPYGSGFAPVKELMTANDIICDSCGWKWAIKDGGNDLFMCHKCGHDNTPKSDPFGLKEYARELVQELKEEITRSDLNQIEKIADEWFEDYGIDVEFTYHFLERVNDPRNGKPISAEELEDLFIKTAEKYGKKLSDFPNNFEAVLNDLRTSINLPFALNYDAKNDEMDLVAKTVMRKRDFKTTSPKLPLEELGKAKKGH
jgi:hypothetical protein